MGNFDGAIVKRFPKFANKLLIENSAMLFDLMITQEGLRAHRYIICNQISVNSLDIVLMRIMSTTQMGQPLLN
jgi:hypothetical protein